MKDKLRSLLKPNNLITFAFLCVLIVAVLLVLPVFSKDGKNADREPEIGEMTEKTLSPETDEPETEEAPTQKTETEPSLETETEETLPESIADTSFDPVETRFSGSEIPDYGDEPSVLPQTDDMGKEYLDKIIFLGDSRTYGLAVYKVIPWENVWAPSNGTLYLGAVSNVKVVCYPSGDEYLIKDAVRIRQPEILLVSLGINGVASMNQSQFELCFKKLITDVREVSPGTHIILNAIYPVAKSYKNLGSINNEKIITANGWILELAKTYGCKYLDSYRVLLDPTDNMDETLQNGDGLHPNREGYEKIVEYVRTHALLGTNPIITEETETETEEPALVVPDDPPEETETGETETVKETETSGNAEETPDLHTDTGVVTSETPGETEPDEITEPETGADDTPEQTEETSPETEKDVPEIDPPQTNNEP